MRKQLHLAATAILAAALPIGVFTNVTAVQAATSTATLSVTATEAFSSTSYTISGTAAMTGGISGSGTFSATFPATALTGTGASSPFTITISGSTLGGTINIPIGWLSGSSGTGSATITSATGSYGGDTGSFPSLAGSGSIGTTGTIGVSFSGSGTITTGGTVTAPPPTITAVLDAASNTPNEAQGGIFIVKGNNLCPGSSTTSFNVPRPTVAPDGVKITFTPAAGGAGTNALLVYEYPVGIGAPQLAGIVPSTLPVGNYNVTVTNGSVSAPFATQVMQSKFSLLTQDYSGNGLALAQTIISATEYDLNRLTSGTVSGTIISPAHPLQNLVAYGTGMAGRASADNDPSPVYDFSTNGVTVKAIVGGMTIPVQFAGLAGYAGEDQINFQLPANVPTSCAEPFQVSVNGVLSNATTLAIAPIGATACTQPGYTTAQLSALDQGGTILTGGFSLSQSAQQAPPYGTVKYDTASGAFTQITAFELSSVTQSSFSSTTVGSCTVTQGTSTLAGVSAGGAVTELDAGAVTLTGPTGSNLNNTPLPESGNTYSATIGEEGPTGVPNIPNGVILAGKYTLTAAGGAGVNGFSTSITLPTPLTVTGGLPTTVNRSQPETLNWSGGNNPDPVTISGSGQTTSGTGANAVTTYVGFVCMTTAGAGTFTIPAAVLSLLPPTPAGSTSATGYLSVSTTPPATSFSPTLTSAAGGGSVASTFSALISTVGSVTYQ